MVESSINSNYPDNAKADDKRLLDTNKNLEKTLEQRRKKKWKKFIDRVDHGYFKPRNMIELQKTGGIIEELNQEKLTVDVESLERRKEREHLPKCYRK